MYRRYSFPEAQMVKNLPAMQDIQVQSLGGDPWVREDSLEKEMATHTSIFAWGIPWTEEPGGLPSMELQRVGHDGVTFTSIPALSILPDCYFTSISNLLEYYVHKYRD